MPRTPQQILEALAALTSAADRLAYIASLEIEERQPLVDYLSTAYDVDEAAFGTATDDEAKEFHKARLSSNLELTAELKKLGDNEPVAFAPEAEPDPLAELNATRAALDAEEDGEEGGGEGESDPSGDASAEDDPKTALDTESEGEEGADDDGSAEGDLSTGDDGGEPAPEPGVSLAQVQEIVGETMAASMDKLAEVLAAKQAPALALAGATDGASDGPDGGAERRPALGQVATLAPSADLGSETPRGHFKTNANVNGVQAGTEFADDEMFAQVFQKGMSSRWNSNGEYTDAPNISGEYAPFMEYVKPEAKFEVTAEMNVDQATTVMELMFEDWHATLDNQMDAVGEGEVDGEIMASGGPCAVEDRDLTITYLGANKSPFKNSLPTMRMPRGRKEFRPPYWYGDVRANPAYDMTGAVGVVTRAQDEALYVSQGGTTPDKSCLTIPCPEDLILCEIDEVYSCVKIGNWVDAFWPEWVRIWRRMVSDYRSEFEERLVMAEVAQIPGTQLMTSSYTGGAGNEQLGALRDTYRDVLSIVTHMRSFHRFGSSSNSIRFRWSVPDWMPIILKMAMATTQGLSPATGFNISTGQMLNWYRQHGLNVSFYCDDSSNLTDRAGAPLGLPAVPPQQLAKPVAGIIPRLPGVARTFLWIEGTVVLGTGPSLEFGQVRDSLLIGTNDWIAFQAEWMRPCYIGPVDSTYILDLELCPQDRGANHVDIVCP